MKSFFFFIFFSLFISIQVYADEINIESDKLIITRNPLTTTFIGNVFAYDDEIKLWSNKVSILYTDDEKKIDQILSFKNSKLVKGNQTIMSDNITYKLIDQKIFAKGHIILTQNEDTMMGDELSIDLADSTSIMKSINENKVKVKIKSNNDIK